MKIVQINTVCNTGSTGKIAADIYAIAKQAGYETYIAYGRGSAPANIQSFKIGNFLDFGCHVLINFFLGKSGFGSKYVTKKFLKWLDKIKPDILHLHNLHGFYLHVGILFEYIKKHDIPVVWTLHDCWPLTGQCAYFDYANCNKWQTFCHHCPIYRSDYPYSLFYDNSYHNYIVKKELFTNVNNMIIITPSNWLADIVKKSFLQKYPISIIPNGINLQLFCPADKQKSGNTNHSHTLATPKIILGVANVWSKSKGLKYFLQLSDMLDQTYHIVLIGLTSKQQSQIQAKYNGRITALTRTFNQQELVSWYQNAFVFVNTTLEDNFPTTNLEALACGTPVITFKSGGSPESITHQCGIVVEKGNIEQLKNAILSLEKRAEITPSACRKQALNYEKSIRFKQYISIYEQLIK